MLSLLVPSLNLVILLGILFVYMKKPLLDYVKTRHVTIKEDLEKVTHELHVAQEDYEEFSSKLRAIDAEILSMREQAKQDAEAMKNKIVTEAKRLASGILADSKINAEAVFSDLKHDLLRESALKILTKAESLMKDQLTGDVKQRIQNDFSKQLGGVQ